MAGLHFRYFGWNTTDQMAMTDRVETKSSEDGAPVLESWGVGIWGSLGAVHECKEPVVVLDVLLTTETQISSVAQPAFYHLHLVRQLVPYTIPWVLVTVTHSVVTSRLDYGNLLYTSLSLYLIQKL